LEHSTLFDANPWCFDSQGAESVARNSAKIRRLAKRCPRWEFVAPQVRIPFVLQPGAQPLPKAKLSLPIEKAAWQVPPLSIANQQFQPTSTAPNDSPALPMRPLATRGHP